MKVNTTCSCQYYHLSAVVLIFELPDHQQGCALLATPVQSENHIVWPWLCELVFVGTQLGGGGGGGVRANLTNYP